MLPIASVVANDTARPMTRPGRQSNRCSENAIVGRETFGIRWKRTLRFIAPWTYGRRYGGGDGQGGTRGFRTARKPRIPLRATRRARAAAYVANPPRRLAREIRRTIAVVPFGSSTPLRKRGKHLPRPILQGVDQTYI